MPRSPRRDSWEVYEYLSSGAINPRDLTNPSRPPAPPPLRPDSTRAESYYRPPAEHAEDQHEYEHGHGHAQLSSVTGREADLLERAHSGLAGRSAYADADHDRWSGITRNEGSSYDDQPRMGGGSGGGSMSQSQTRSQMGNRSTGERRSASPSRHAASPYKNEEDEPVASGSGSNNAIKSEPTTTGKRAAKACLRCRKQKLRCLGGWPCDRCTKSKNTCLFARESLSGYPDASGAGSTSRVHEHHRGESGDGNEAAVGGGGGGAEANARLQQLESSVATLLAGLSGSGATGIPTLKELLGGENSRTMSTSAIPGMRGTDPDLRTLSFSSAISNVNTNDGRPILPQPGFPGSGLGSGTAMPPWQTLPPPLHTRPLEAPRSGHLETLPSLSPDTSGPISQGQGQHVRFTSSPHVMFGGQSLTSPSNHTSSAISPASGLSGTTAGGGERREKKLGKGQKAEERLAVATEGGFEPPFKALVYQPAVWDNKEQSRRSSPQPSGGTLSRDELSGNPYDRRYGREKDDPVTTGLVDLRMAQTLFDFFVDHCHPFLPIVNVALSDPFQTIRQSPFLISAIVAISARFFIRYSLRSSSFSTSTSVGVGGGIPPLDPSLPARLANLAETHLSQTLLRKNHALSDVQAILLLSAWGLQSGGKGPDAWVVTGHAARVARRLGVHKILARATEEARRTLPGSEEWTKLEAFMPQWRTWLTWFCFDGLLSLGFGRPQSTQFETVDEQGFLQLRLSQPLPRPGSTSSISLYGDVYIAGQVQLTQIGRDLVNWGEMLADPDRARLDDPRRVQMFSRGPKRDEGEKGKMEREGDIDIRTMFRELNGRLDEWSKLWVWSGSQYSLYLGSSARIARLQAEHMRLCLNSYALKARPDEDELVGQCLKKALNAAMSTIQTHFESSQTDQALSFATDYLTITLAQAAVFLIRIIKSPNSVQAVVNLDPSVVAHYLTMSFTLLESADLSETRLSTYLAKTIREIARAAGIGGLPPATPGLYTGDEGEDVEGEKGYGGGGLGVSTGGVGGTGVGSFLNVMANGMNGANGYPGNGSISSPGIFGIGSTTFGNGNGNPMSTSAEEPFDLESFLQLESQVDLGYLLGLPGDFGVGGGSGTGGMANGSGSGDGMISAGAGGGGGAGGNGWGGAWDTGGIGEFTFGNGMSGGMGLGWMDLGESER